MTSRSRSLRLRKAKTVLTERISPYISKANLQWVDKQVRDTNRPYSEVVDDALTKARENDRNPRQSK